MIISDKGKKFLRISIISALICGLALLYFFVDARYSDFFPRCPFFTLTGLYCSGCGSQRAVSALLHGNFIIAIHYNAMFVASLPIVLYSAFVSLGTTIYEITRDSGEKRTMIWLKFFKPDSIPQKIFYSPVFVKVLLVLIVLFWVLRNIPFYPFTVLAPV